MREIRRQLRPLERQAEAARRHGGLLVELDGLRRHLFGREIDQLRRRVRQITQDQAADRRETGRLEVQVEALDRDLAAAESQLGAVDGQDVGDALMRFEALAERLRGLGALLAERRLRLHRERSAGVDEDVVATLEAESDRLAGELDKVRADADALLPREAEVADAEQLLEHQRQEFNRQWGDRAGRDSGSDAPRVKGEIRVLEGSIQRDQAEAERFAATLEESEGRRTSLVEALDRCWSEAAEAEAAQQLRQRELEAAEQSVGTARGAGEQARAALARAAGDRRAWDARIEALSAALDEARDRSGAECLAGIDGVVGTLLEIVDIDRGWEDAFEAAAGEAVAAVVAADTEAAMRAVATLERDSVAGAVLALGGAGAPAPLPAEGAPLRPHVRSSVSGVDRLLDALIGGVGVVDSSEQAAAAAIADPAAVVVTRRGDRFSSSGWRVGVRRSGATRGLLEEAVRKSAAASEAQSTASDAVAQADRVLAEAEKAVVAARRAALSRSEAVSEVRDRAGRLERELRDVEVGIEALGPRVRELDSRIAQDRRRVAGLRDELPRHEARELEERDMAERMNLARSELSQRSEDVGRRRSELRIRAAGLQERERLLSAQRDDIESRLSRMSQARSEVAARRDAIDKKLAVLDALIALVADRSQSSGLQLEGLRRRRAEQSQAVRSAVARLDDLRRRRSQAEAELGRRRERDRALDVELAEAAVKLESAVERCRRELGCEPGEAVAAECPPLDPGVAPGDRVKALEQELRIIGPVNPLALEQYEELSERHEFTQGQIDDIRQSRRELRRVIRKIDEEIISVFSSAYADVSRNFAELFQTLFPGGEGSLRLTQPDALLDTGVDIEARPSGKNVRRLSLLSGGERSLTAMAFLFAVFRSRPSPFYVMDEVEAALDDVNLHRFLDLVDEFRSDAQMLIVSHQKRTMEAADCLYGVSMKPGGSSKAISEKVVVASAPKILLGQS